MAKHADDPVTKLLKIHAAHELRSYMGNLVAVVHAIENNWVPSQNDPGVPEFVESLQRRLSDSGLPEEDSFLLRYGLTAPGRQRGIVPPMMVLAENRGGFSARRQREAEGQIRRLREALTIGRFYRAGLGGDTRQAILELADLCDRLPRPSDAQWLLQFRHLDEAQAERLAAEAIQAVDTDDPSLADVGTQILQRLACLRDDGLSEAVCNRLIAKGVFWPASLYREASESVAGRLVGRINQAPDPATLNHLLLALAWTRSGAALRAFRQWSEYLPRWAQSLHKPPAAYLPAAGWRLDEAGDRCELVSPNCYRLACATDCAAGNVACRTPRGEPCPSCGGPQAWLFDFADVDAAYFTGVLAGAPRRVACCLHCCCYEIVFTRYHPDGSVEWLFPFEQSRFDDSDGDRLEPCFRTLETSPIPPFAHAEPHDLGDASTLGGIPMWLQEAEFPRCIDCGQFMTFLAQHDNGPLSEEGVFYAFFCASCRVAAVTYQQT